MRFPPMVFETTAYAIPPLRPTDTYYTLEPPNCQMFRAVQALCSGLTLHCLPDYNIAWNLHPKQLLLLLLMPNRLLPVPVVSLSACDYWDYWHSSFCAVWSGMPSFAVPAGLRPSIL